VQRYSYAALELCLTHVDMQSAEPTIAVSFFGGCWWLLSSSLCLGLSVCVAAAVAFAAAVAVALLPQYIELQTNHK